MDVRLAECKNTYKRDRHTNKHAVIYLGVNPDTADFFKSGRSISVSRKWPKWLVPICISKPSSVFSSGQAIMPIFYKGI